VYIPDIMGDNGQLMTGIDYNIIFNT